MVPLLMSIGSSIAVLFTIEFLNIKSCSLKLYKFLKTLFWANVIMSILVLVLSYRLSSTLASLLSIISIIVILSSSIYSHFSSKNPYAKFFALAWGSLLMGIFIIHFRNLGFFPVNTFTSYSPLIGAFVELTLLALVLAYRYNIQQEELTQKNSMLFKQSKLASMGEMISNIAHQWRQPLNRVNLSLAVISQVLVNRGIEDKTIATKIKNSEDNIQYMSQTINDFSDFFAPNKVKSSFIIDEAVKKALVLLESRVKDINIYHSKSKDTLTIHGYENEYIQVILVILNNAIDNFDTTDIQQKDIHIDITQSDKQVTLNIKDNGGGISKDVIEHIFEPYFTTKFKKEGTGIGLYMAKMLIENSMHGELKVSSKDRQSCFKIISVENSNE